MPGSRRAFPGTNWCRATPRRPTELLRFLQIRAVARLFRARTGQAGHRRDPPGRPGPRFRLQISGAPAADRSGADGGRGIRHHQGECRAQRHRDHRSRALHPVAGAALVAHHFRGFRLPCRRTVRHRRARHADGRHAQSDLGLFRRTVRRPRRRFRPAIFRPLSGGTARGRQSARGAVASRPPRRRAADARRLRDGRRLPVVPADGLQGRFRTRSDCRRRHADRVRHQRHAAAGFVKRAQAAERTGAARLQGAGAGRSLFWRGIACRS